MKLFLFEIFNIELSLLLRIMKIPVKICINKVCADYCASVACTVLRGKNISSGINKVVKNDFIIATGIHIWFVGRATRLQNTYKWRCNQKVMYFSEEKSLISKFKYNCSSFSPEFAVQGIWNCFCHICSV